jgi:predicted nucleotidyltransferase
MRHVQLGKTGVKLQTYSGHQFSVVGEAVVPVKYKSHETQERLIVVKVEDNTPVLERNCLGHIS